MSTQPSPLVRSSVIGKPRHRVSGLALALLAGCGGGGGGGGGPVISPETFETPEYEASDLGTIRASHAYAAGATGNGQTVAVIDTGIASSHPEFAGAISSDSIDIVTGLQATLGDIDGHGTAVSGLIVGRRNDLGGHGVAFDAEVMAIRADEPGSCATGCTFRQSDIAAATDHASDHGAGVINYSLGGAVLMSSTLRAALARAVDQGSILVFAAGNDAAASPAFASQFVTTTGAHGRALVVGALDQSGELASFSARAGISSDVFLVAPGVQVLAPDLDGDFTRLTGTSFAAPQVSGAAALLRGASPFLSANDVVDILLASATDLGTPGVDPIYGHGLLDLGSALSPLGELTLPTGADVEAGGSPLETSALSLGPAFGPTPDIGRLAFLDAYGRPFSFAGDALVSGAERRTGLALIGPRPQIGGGEVALESGRLRLQTIETAPDQAPFDPMRDEEAHSFRLAFDNAAGPDVIISEGFGLTHEFGLGASATRPDSTLVLARLDTGPLELAGSGRALVVADDLGSATTLRLGLTHDGAEAGPGTPEGARSGAAAGITTRLAERLTGTLHLGGIEEQDGPLGSRGSGALALGSARTAHLGAGAAIDLDPLTRAFAGFTAARTAGSDRTSRLVRERSALTSVGFGFGVTRGDVLAGRDELTLGVAQPLRVMAGGAHLDIPTGRTFEGAILRERREVSLAPEGREIDVELGYRRPLGANTAMSMNWATRLEPDHREAAPPEHLLAVRLRHLW